MRTYLRIPAEQSKDLFALNEKLYAMCEKLEPGDEWTCCFPKGGNLLSVIQLLSRHQIRYEIKVIESK